MSGRSVGVCLTGDVHERSRRSREQRFLRGTELDSLAAYAEIARTNGLRPTIFLSGRAAIEGAELLRTLVRAQQVELGGHWFAAFPWLLPYRAFGRIGGLRRGPAWLQARDVRRTIQAIESASGWRIRAWRDHAYRQDRNTARILAQQGIGALSDSVDLNRTRPEVRGGILDVPINTLPDHENIRHLPSHGTADRPMIDITEWATRVERQVAELVSQGGVAVVLAHPSCMKASDEFRTFRQLCASLARFPVLTFEDLVRSTVSEQQTSLHTSDDPSP